ncbi:MAG TPA: DNA repair protein RecN [Candidatus Dorea gallistercoris]|uniref:DNA repair protein RecN n=1 Tax=Candidatus Dorea gallistercoris TaxID=2838542 RepID=A0A9D1RB21_9FIRM|nr:DNA repair protein RecN [Candidatus Dorea gallistercoris]
MLRSLHVKNLALIDEIEVEFEEGLNILTGETGAGKSIILGSVNLALGARYTKDMIRSGADYGFVELEFQIENPRQLQRLKELEVFPEDGMVVLSRRLMEGRSVSRINGETVTMALLREVSQILIDIHGQHEHQSLLHKKNHLEILDAFAREETEDILQQVKEAYQAYRTCGKELKEANMDESERAKELSFLEFEVQEIEEAALVKGEDEELEDLYRRMANGKKIAKGAAEAYCYTSQDADSASENLSRAIRALSEAADCDERARQLQDQLMEVDSLLNDFNRELSDYSKECEFSEEEFYETENRLNAINHLKVKYGNTIEEILDYQAEQKAKLEKLQDYETYLARLKRDLEQAESLLEKRSQSLSKARKEQAAILEQAVEQGLRELNFADVRFQIHFERLEAYTGNGIDDVEFMISLNPGQPLRPLKDVASGGELSRIMLAIRTVMARRDDIETLIFDEIDVGISGRTAQKVSEKMALIGKTHQVICITHLAQIAAMADTHYVIEKKVEGMDTRTQIRRLDGEASIQELARILGGAKITDAVLENAREMKELAQAAK